MTSDEIFQKLEEASELENKINRCISIINNSDDRFITNAINCARQIKLESYQRRLHQLNTELHRVVFGV